MSTTTPTTRVDPAAVREFYDRNGYYVFRNALSRDAIKAVHDCLERDVYPNTAPLLRHPAITKATHTYRQALDGSKFVANALYNPHLEAETERLGKAIVDLVCCDETGILLEAIDGEPQHTMHQAILFFVSPGTDAHIDGWALDTVPPGNFATMWVSLETISLRNGPVGVFPWKRGQLLTPEMLGVDLAGKDNRTAYFTYTDALVRSIKERGISCVVPQLEPGDFIVFSSLTPHATMPPMNEHMRRMALQILVRPTQSRWGGILMSRLNGEGSDGDPKASVTVSKRWRAVSHS